MSRFVGYDTSGRVFSVIDVPDMMDAVQSAALGPGESLAIAPGWADYKTAYVSNGVVMERQPLNLAIPAPITADGQDEAVITGIPAGVSVTWPDGQIDEVPDGEVRFSVDLPGTYRLRFTAVEYLDQEVAIEAVAPA